MTSKPRKKTKTASQATLPLFAPKASKPVKKTKPAGGKTPAVSAEPRKKTKTASGKTPAVPARPRRKAGDGRGRPSAEVVRLADFVESAYLDYSMSVVLDRALPALGDGLKPVQRRIVYAMSELGLSHQTRPKKAARTVGDVLGKFHPHGDAACYEAMVLMAQDFSYRYPLLEGQGNWGSIDNPKSFAAMRYTEARLAPYAQVLVSELGFGTADWKDNFDGTLREPVILPARLPNVLLNGTSGIGVGMATDVPPHNLGEVVAACIELLERSRGGIAELMRHIKAPDFPGGCDIVSGAEEIARVYESGSGSIRMRAVYHLEGKNLVITALPHQLSVSRALEQIAQQLRERKPPLLSDLRDESDERQPVRLVLVPHGRAFDGDAVMSHLFSTTELERSCRVNLNVIGDDGKPQVKGLSVLLNEWLDFRKKSTRRRLEWRVARIKERLEILEGFLAAYARLDEVIQIIREADEPALQLEQRLGLSAVQSKAILDMRLRRLARLHEAEVHKERDDLLAERNKLEACLQSAARFKTLIKKELKADAKTYGDERRSRLRTAPPARALRIEAQTPAEPMTVVLSHMGWVRAARGHEADPETMSYRTTDGLLAAVHGNSQWPVLFVDEAGRAYTVPTHSLPSARGLGEPLSGRLSLSDGVGLCTLATAPPDTAVIAANDHGYGFCFTFSDALSSNRRGKQLLRLPEGARPCPLAVCESPGAETLVLAASSEGYMLAVRLEELPRLRGGRGRKIINVPRAARTKQGERLVAVACLNPKQTLRVHVRSGQSKKFSYEAVAEQFLMPRARRGLKLGKKYRKVVRLEAVD